MESKSKRAQIGLNLVGNIRVDIQSEDTESTNAGAALFNRVVPHKSDLVVARANLSPASHSILNDLNILIRRHIARRHDYRCIGCGRSTNRE